MATEVTIRFLVHDLEVYGDDPVQFAEELVYGNVDYADLEDFEVVDVEEV